MYMRERETQREREREQRNYHRRYESNDKCMARKENAGRQMVVTY